MTPEQLTEVETVRAFCRGLAAGGREEADPNAQAATALLDEIATVIASEDIAFAIGHGRTLAP